MQSEETENTPLFPLCCWNPKRSEQSSFSKYEKDERSSSAIFCATIPDPEEM